MHFFLKKVFTGLYWGPITRLHRRGAALENERHGPGGQGFGPLSSLTLLISRKGCAGSVMAFSLCILETTDRLDLSFGFDLIDLW